MDSTPSGSQQEYPPSSYRTPPRDEYDSGSDENDYLSPVSNFILASKVKNRRVSQVPKIFDLTAPDLVRLKIVRFLQRNPDLQHDLSDENSLSLTFKHAQKVIDLQSFEEDDVIAANELELLTRMRRFALCTGFEETKGNSERQAIQETVAFMLD